MTVSLCTTSRYPLKTGKYASRSPLLEKHFGKTAPGEMAVPHHFHHYNEKVCLILEGEAALRMKNRRKIVKAGDLLFFTTGPGGAHQLYYHTQKPLRYLDLVARNRPDVCGSPDTGKINCEGIGIYRKEDSVLYFNGEEQPSPFWSEAADVEDR
jgi:uncharacterized cupin superfamily protein